MTESKKSFWTSFPGILTGAAALITAGTGLYIAMTAGNETPGEQEPGPVVEAQPATPLTSNPPPSEWPLIADETFSALPQDQSRKWNTGNFQSQSTRRFEIRYVGGKYRWDMDFAYKRVRWVLSPYPSTVNFYAAVDMKLTHREGSKGAGIIFGRAASRHYNYLLNSSKKFTVTYYDGSKTRTYHEYTPVDVDLNETNRMAVAADGSDIKLFMNSELVGEFRDQDFSGGNVGLVVSSWDTGTVVVDFDNFEYRRKN